MGMINQICPNCCGGRNSSVEVLCQAPECQELLATPKYILDEIEGNLWIAERELARGDTSQNWVEIVRNFQVELLAYAKPSRITQ